jgi:fumarylacetoacetate (FAA) hydrolase
MRLGTLRESGRDGGSAGGRDGTLVVVARDGTRFARATAIAPTLQAALDAWPHTQPALMALSARLDNGEVTGEPLIPTAFTAPLPRAYEWIDGSAFLSHVRLARRSRGAEPPPDLLTNPLVYQGGSGVLLGPRDPLPRFEPAFGLDFEAELAVITGDVPMGITPAAAASCVRLVCLLNDVTLRGLVPGELAKGFGFLQSKPSTAFAPYAVTPDELGGAWRDGRVHLPVLCFRNGVAVGHADAGEMHFSFHDLIAHAARTRRLLAGTIIGSGTVSSDDASAGVSCLVEARMREILATGSATTEYLRPGDAIRIEVRDDRGRDVFGRIEQHVESETPAGGASR